MPEEPVTTLPSKEIRRPRERLDLSLDNISHLSCEDYFTPGVHGQSLAASPGIDIPFYCGRGGAGLLPHGRFLTTNALAFLLPFIAITSKVGVAAARRPPLGFVHGGVLPDKCLMKKKLKTALCSSPLLLYAKYLTLFSFGNQFA